jgi:osmotically-inducible protein OsmY
LTQGVLFLRGNLDSFYLKQVAQEAVVCVKGTTRLVNEIVVGRGTGREEAENRHF